MTKHSWKESMKSFWSHIDPEKDEQLKWMKIEIDTKVKRILKLIKSVNQGNKEGISKRKSDLIQLVEDFHLQYQMLYSHYDNLRGEVSKKIYDRGEEGSSSSSSSSSLSNSDSESYYSPDNISVNSGSKNELENVTDGFNEKFENSNSEDAYLKDKLTSTIEVVKEALNVESTSSLSELSESGKIIKDLRIEVAEAEGRNQKVVDECSWLKEKLVEKENELLSLSQTHQAREAEASARIRDLEGHVTSLKLEQEKLYTQKRELEHKTAEANQVGEENIGLRTRISELETTYKEKEDELSAFLKKFEENENHLMSKIEDFGVQANHMKLEMDSLSAQKCELEEQLLCEKNEGSAHAKGLIDQLNVLQQEMESLSTQKTESEFLLEKKSQEISECIIQIENLKEKLASKTMDEQGTSEKKEGLKVQVKDLKVEVNSLHTQKSDVKEQIMIINTEKEELHSRIFGLETTLNEREAEVSTLQNKIEARDKDVSTHVISLTSHVNNLQQELDSFQTQKNLLETQTESEKHEYLQNLNEIEKRNIELTDKIANQQRTLKGLENVVNKSNEEHKLVKGRSLDSKFNPQNAERKMEEMAEDFRRNFEDNLRILSRRIMVAEQLHVENKEWYRKTKDKCEQEHKDLKDKMATYEATFRKVKDISVTANEMLIAVDTTALKFEECSANFLNRISKVSCELKFAKDWVVRKNNAFKDVLEDLDCLLARLDEKEAKILGLREKDWKLESKVRELEKVVKEKEDGMLDLKEEKREAIRQLCVWIDHHRGRSDYYKKMLSDITVRSQKIA